MAIKFAVKPGTIVVCDYSGNKSPEMIKIRPVVVVSPIFRSRPLLATVVPLSLTPPAKIEEYHREVKLDRPLPKPFRADAMWAKCDMVSVVSFDRLTLIGIGRAKDGKRRYIQPRISDEMLTAIRQGAAYSIGLKLE